MQTFTQAANRILMNQSAGAETVVVAAAEAAA
jgi:hypothetical protein